MRQPYQLIGHCYKNDYLRADAQRCVNLVVKNNALINTPGLSSWGSAGSGPIRGMKVRNNELFVVSGNTCYGVNTGGSATSRGTINNSTGPVSMAYDGTTVVMVNGAGGWAYEGGNIRQIFGLPPKPTHVVFADGFFLVNNSGGGAFYKSTEAFNAFQWSGEFATAEQNPDNLINITEHKSDLWLFGPHSTEVWYYSGAAAFPWDPNRGAFQDYGLQAKHSVSKFDNGLAWLASSEEIGLAAVRSRGFQVSRISTSAIEREWANYSTTNDAISYSFQYPGLGHFWVLTFPTANATWVYEAETQGWFEWERYAPPFHGRHISNCYAQFNGKHLVGDYNSGNIYELDVDVYTDNGTAIRREICGEEAKSNRQRIFYNSFELELHAGRGLATGQGQTPVMYLQYTPDMGKTWSNPKSMSLGKAGGYLTRARATRLGSGRSRIFRLYTAEPIEFASTNATIDVELGSN